MFTMTDLCQELKNWFDRGMPRCKGSFVIEGGQLADCSFLQDGQYFRIDGSVFNDGVHRWPADDLQDESFRGTIVAMAVPPTVIALSEEIAMWDELYGGVTSQAMSPFNSEQFGGYAYTKGGGGSGSSGSGTSASGDWRYAYASQLNRWRKI